MQLELTEKEFRRLLDMVYIGNWILNSCRDDDRFEDYEAMADYEDAVFYDILAEELARRDMSAEQISQDDAEELNARMEEYFAEFEKHGIENVKVEA